MHVKQDFVMSQRSFEWFNTTLVLYFKIPPIIRFNLWRFMAMQLISADEKGSLPIPCFHQKHYGVQISLEKSLMSVVPYRYMHSMLAPVGRLMAKAEKLLEDKSASAIDDPQYSQPLCTILQIALVDLLRAFDVAAAAVVRHSPGEIAAV